MILATVVVLPVPGPPDMIHTLFRTAVTAATRCQSVSSRSPEGKSRAVPSPRWTVPHGLALLGVPFMSGWAWLTKTHALYTRESLSVLRADARVCLDKAREDLDYSPRPLKQTLQDTYDWLAQSGRLRTDKPS